MIIDKDKLGLPWNYISRTDSINGSGLQYGVQEWGLRNKYMCFIGKFMPQDVAEVILNLVNDKIND